MGCSDVSITCISTAVLIGRFGEFVILEAEQITEEKINELYGDSLAKLVASVVTMNAIGALKVTSCTLPTGEIYVKKLCENSKSGITEVPCSVKLTKLLSVSGASTDFHDVFFLLFCPNQLTRISTHSSIALRHL